LQKNISGLGFSK